MDNLETLQQQDNSQAQDQSQASQKIEITPFTWKTKLSADIQKSPTLQKFDDTPEGLAKAVESHLNLEKLLGHEKVPIPKGPEDSEGWARFSKAFGIPDKADGYGLKDAQIPESMKGMTFDKGKFAEIVHKNRLTPDQANGLWSAYTQMSMEAYNKAIESQKAKMTNVINALRQEWGDGYDANVDLGQTVISKFAGDQETADFLTAVLASDPRGVKFLAKIGGQFAENKVGEFSLKRYALTPEQAQVEIDSIIRDPNHPYMNEKASQAERDRAIEYVNSLYAVMNRSRG